MKTLYTTQATAKGGINGTVKSDNGVLDFEVSMPKGLGGANDDFANPKCYLQQDTLCVSTVL